MTYAPQGKDNSSPQHQQQTTKATAQTFSDNRESTLASLPLQAMMANSPQQQKLKSAAQLTVSSPVQQKLNTSAQNFANKSEPMQRMDDEEPLQGKFEIESEPAQLEATSEAPRPNNTGLPDNLKAGIENLSGMSMDHVKVHYNSDKPAQLQAHAYAQGSEIHVAPGQEKHLPHEAWHVVQQAQGRVRPTMQMKGDMQVNDDTGLEAEADLMGSNAFNTGIQLIAYGHPSLKATQHTHTSKGVLQRALPPGAPDTGGFYTAQHDKNALAPYAGGRPTNFSVAFKENLLEHKWNAKQDESGVWHVMTPDSKVVVLPSNAIQIDHIEPWDKIADYLTTYAAPNSFKGTYMSDKKGNYTVHAARMYYHDINNLKPMAPSDNAGKGKKVTGAPQTVSEELQEQVNEMSANMHDVGREASAAYFRVAGNGASKTKKRVSYAEITDEVNSVQGPLIDAYNNLVDIK
jgi:hypothetical protein